MRRSSWRSRRSPISAPVSAASRIGAPNPRMPRSQQIGFWRLGRDGAVHLAGRTRPRARVSQPQEFLRSGSRRGAHAVAGSRDAALPAFRPLRWLPVPASRPTPRSWSGNGARSPNSCSTWRASRISGRAGRRVAARVPLSLQDHAAFPSAAPRDRDDARFGVWRSEFGLGSSESSDHGIRRSSSIPKLQNSKPQTLATQPDSRRRRRPIPIGFLRQGTRFDIVDVPHCPIATEAINVRLGRSARGGAREAGQLHARRDACCCARRAAK